MQAQFLHPQKAQVDAQWRDEQRWITCVMHPDIKWSPVWCQQNQWSNKQQQFYWYVWKLQSTYQLHLFACSYMQHRTKQNSYLMQSSFSHILVHRSRLFLFCCCDWSELALAPMPTPIPTWPLPPIPTWLILPISTPSSIPYWCLMPIPFQQKMYYIGALDVAISFVFKRISLSKFKPL